MLRTERYRMIESIVNEKQLISISDLTEALNASKATVYRDLKELDRLGRVQAIRGGAAKAEYLDSISADRPYDEKTTLNAEEKARIAHAACGMLEPGMTIYLDSSTTVYHMCDELAAMQDIRVITNDVHIAARLSNAPGISVYVSGGYLRKNYYTLTSFTGETFLNQLTANITFASCDAITAERGCMITNSDEVSIKKQMLAIASKRVLLCDHSKFNHTAFVTFAPLEEIDHIIVGRELPEGVCSRFEEKGVTLMLV